MAEYTKGEIKNMEGWVLNKEPQLGKDTYILWIAGEGEIVRLTTKNEANAHLIAAAPDMYEALKGLLIGLHSSRRRIGVKLEENMMKGHLALAKAERENV